MKVLKVIFLVIVVLIAAVLLIALFVKKDYNVARSVTIHKPASEVFGYVKMLKNQDYYNKWVMQDPAMKKEFKGTDGMVGFIYAWNGNKDVGEGEQEIKSVVPDKSMESEIRFKRPMESTAMINIHTEAVSPAETKVSWSMQGKSTYPLNIMNLFMDGMLGKDMDSSLHTLKANLEQQ